MDQAYVMPKYLTGEDIRHARQSLGMTQKEFAQFAGCALRTVENWETKAEKVTGPVVTLLNIVLRRPALVRKLQVPPQRYYMRVWYMYRHLVCTIIDVDERNREIEVTNYTDDPLFRAFGVKLEPEYEDYEAFLESRCFPRTRDKMKIQLKELDIPFYDPLLIIEKTQGRMADDDFWLKVEVRRQIDCGRGGDV